MDRLQVAVPYLFFCLLAISGVILADVCELTFNTEAESLMLLEGRSGSVVCDGTCFGGRGDVVYVLWTDMLGNKVLERGASLYAVPHSQYLLSQLVIKNATSELSGTFTCSVVKGGRLIQSKSMSVFIFERHPPRSRLFPQMPRGPRRGDQLILADISNRPVRSAEMSSSSDAASQAGANGGDWRSSGEAKVTAQDNGVDLVDVDYETQEDRDYAAMELLEAMAWRKKLEKLRNEAPLPGADSDVMLQDRGSKVVGSGPVNHELLPEARRLSEDLESDELSDLRENKAFFEDSVFTLRLSRHRRDDSNNMTGTTGDSLNTSTENATARDENTSGETISVSPTSVSPTSVSATSVSATSVSPTSVSTTFVSTTSSPTTATTSPTTSHDNDPDENGGATKPGKNEGNPPCTASPEPTNFGKYGILAFAVSLSLAFLLLYAILMILFMPRILARRSSRRKSDLEAPIYRKKNSDVGEIPPMPINLNDSTPSEIDLDDAPQKKDMNSSLTSQSTNEDDAKKVDAGPAVSTFLLRQASVNNKGSESGDTKESATAGDKVTEEVTQNKTDKPAPEKPEDIAKSSAEVEGPSNTNLADLAENLPETNNIPKAIGDKTEIKPTVPESDLDLPPFPDPLESAPNKDIIDV